MYITDLQIKKYSDPGAVQPITCFLYSLFIHLFLFITVTDVSKVG